MTIKVDQVFAGAINVLNVDGWAQGFAEKDGCYCMMGALRKSATLLTSSSSKVGCELFNEARDMAIAKVIANFPDTFGKVFLAPTARWNDAHGRTKEQVIAFLNELREESILKANNEAQ